MISRRCERCGKRFYDTRTSERKLLDALFYKEHICDDCYLLLRNGVCCVCHKPGADLIGLNGKLFHPQCLPY